MIDVINSIFSIFASLNYGQTFLFVFTAIGAGAKKCKVFIGCVLTSEIQTDTQRLKELFSGKADDLTLLIQQRRV